MASLADFYRAVLYTDAELPYALVVRAARWGAEHEPLRAQSGMVDKLTAADAVALLPILANGEARPPKWALARVLSHVDLTPELAAEQLALESRPSVRAAIAAHARAESVLEILSHDEYIGTLAEVADNEHATEAQQVRAIAAVDTRLADQLAAGGKRGGMPDILERIVPDKRASVLSALALLARTGVLVRLLCNDRITEDAAVLLLERHVLPAVTANGHDDDLPNWWDAAARLARHGSARVREQLTDALRAEDPTGFPHASLRALLDGTIGTPVTLKSATGGLFNDQLTPTFDRFADMDDTAWAAFERLADTFHGSLAELVDIATDVARPVDAGQFDAERC
jgi:hypothetical protein